MEIFLTCTLNQQTNAMKIFFTITLIFISIITNAQPALTYTEVVNVDSISKAELYSRARSWFNEAFKSSQNVLNIQDKETGELSGTGVMKYTPTVWRGNTQTIGIVRFNVTIKIKDGRYKYEFTNFTHEGSVSRNTYGKLPASSFGLITITDTCSHSDFEGYQNWKNKVWVDIKNQINININPMIEALKKKMNQPAKSDSW